MPNSFRYLLAVTGLVALLFAAISAWPLMSNWLRSRQAPPVQPVTAVATPAPPTSTGVNTGPGRSRAIPTQVRPLPQSQPCNPCQDDDDIPANATNVRQLGGSYIPGRWTTGDGEDSLGWCTALDTIHLYNRPDGAPLIPVNLNRCPLTVSKGTRLGMIRQEGSWLLVHSTFATTGWVRKRDVSEITLGEETLYQ